MRLNQYVARYTGMSRRAADIAIRESRISVNGSTALLGQTVSEHDTVTIDGRAITPSVNSLTIIMNKPVGYVCSREGQGSKTIYELLPPNLRHLKSVGRLDKDSSGLLLLTNDGNLAHELTHPKFSKTKVYKIAVNKPLDPTDQQQIRGNGVMLADGISKLQLDKVNSTDYSNWKVTMQEGRNRQIRRTFEALGYKVIKLHRTQFGTYKLDSLPLGKYHYIN